MKCTVISNREELKIKGKNEMEQPYTQMKMRLMSILAGLYEKGCSEFYVNCEEGIPLWTAEAVCVMKSGGSNIRLNIVAPYEDQTTEWTEDLRDRYYAVHESADTVRFAERHLSENSFDAADEIMLDGSDLLLVFGSPSDKLHAVEYAEKISVKIQFASLAAPDGGQL